jgi:hypothetical protein
MREHADSEFPDIRLHNPFGVRMTIVCQLSSFMEPQPAKAEIIDAAASANIALTAGTSPFGKNRTLFPLGKVMFRSRVPVFAML